MQPFPCDHGSAVNNHHEEKRYDFMFNSRSGWHYITNELLLCVHTNVSSSSAKCTIKTVQKYLLMKSEMWQTQKRQLVLFMSWMYVTARMCLLCTHPSCQGCLWRNTWGWRQCLDRREVSVCHSPPDLLCPKEPTPPDQHWEKRRQRRTKDEIWWKENKEKF